MQNSASGTGDTDGIALISDGNADKYVWNYDNTSLRFGTNAIERMRITSAGIVGLGTTTPRASNVNAKALHIHNTLSGSNPAPAEVTFSNGRTGQGATDGGVLTYYQDDFYLWNYESEDLIFGTAATERMRIDSSGLVQISMGGSGYATLFRYGSNEDNFIRSGVNGVTAFGDHNGGERMRIDSSGSVGIGLTNPGDYHASANSLVTSSGITLANTSQGSIFFADSATGTGEYVGQINYEHGSNYMQFVTNNGERMRINSAGSLLVGTTSTSGFPDRLITAGDHTRTSSYIDIRSSLVGALLFADGLSGTAAYRGQVEYGHSDDSMRLWTAASERMRISSQGATWGAVNTSVAGFGSTIHYHGWRQGNGNQWVGSFVNEGSSAGYGVIVQHQNTTQDASHWFFNCNNNNGNKAIIYTNGGLANIQSNDANLCDEREKKNIEALDSTWGCLKNWELKKFHYNEDADTDDKRYGVIAQQIAEYCPEVITDWTKRNAEDAVLDEDGNVVTPAVEEIIRMGVKEQQMMWMAIKALQEAQARIETLEQRLADAGIA